MRNDVVEEPAPHALHAGKARDVATPARGGLSASLLAALQELGDLARRQGWADVAADARRVARLIDGLLRDLQDDDGEPAEPPSDVRLQGPSVHSY